MADLSLTLVVKDYAQLAPLACGDVRADGIELKLDRDTRGAIDRTLKDASVQLGESSISRHVARLASGDHTWVGIPVFIARGFRHRCFFVRRTSGYESFRDLVGKRIGTDNWMATGNTWSRAAMREQGVDIGDVEWVCGPIDGPPQDRPQGNLPPNAAMAPPGRRLREMLLDGELDALMCPDPPDGFYQPDSPFVRLFPDYRRVEAAYFERTRVWPAHHIIVMRRELFEQIPWAARAVYQALDSSRARWLSNRLALAETPWMLDELEQDATLMGDDWWSDGEQPNLEMLRTFCAESFAQGLIPRPVDPASVFAEFREAQQVAV